MLVQKCHLLSSVRNGPASVCLAMLFRVASSSRVTPSLKKILAYQNSAHHQYHSAYLLPRYLGRYLVGK